MHRSGPGLLRDHDYRGLFASTTVSQLGHQVLALALPLVALQALSAGAFQVGLVYALTTAAFLLVGLPAGAWVDRIRRRPVLIASDLARAALLATVPLAWWAGLLTLWQLYAVALLTGGSRVLFDVAYLSYLPFLVGRDRLVEANAKLEGVRSVTDVGGPAAAGQAIQLLTAPVALLVDAAALALSATFVARIRRREPPPHRAPQARLVREVAEGLRFVLRHRLLRPIALSAALASLFGAAYAAMLVVFLVGELGLAEGAVGVVFAVAATGGVLGALGARRFAGWLGPGRALWLSIAVTAPGGLPMPFAGRGLPLGVAVGGLLVVAAGATVYDVTQVSLRQALTPDQLLGRMNATMRFLVWGAMPLGGLLGGALGQGLGVRPALLIGGAGLTLGFLPVVLSPLRRLRHPGPGDP